MALLCLMLSRPIPGSPTATTGDWFDTTYDLVGLR
jgi:hypothetical protein